MGRILPAPVFFALFFLSGIWTGALLSQSLSPGLLILFLWIGLLCAGCAATLAPFRKFAGISAHGSPGSRPVSSGKDRGGDVGSLLPLLAGFFFLGSLLGALAMERVAADLLHGMDGRKVWVLGRVMEAPEGRLSPGDAAAEVKSFPLQVTGIVEEHGLRPLQGTLLVRVRESSRNGTREPAPRRPGPQERVISAGDLFLAFGVVQEVQELKNPGIFSYKDYLARKGIHHLLHALQLLPVEGRKRLVIWEVARPLKEKIQRFFQQTLSPAPAGVLQGILLGWKGGIPLQLQRAFQKTGTTHILVASGSNLAVITASIFFLGKLLGLSNQVSSLFCFPFLLLYTLLVGPEPSILRATAMALLTLFALLLGREEKTHPLDLVNLLAIAALILSSFSPLILFDLGFQLSCLSVLGIVLLTPLLRKKLQPLPGFVALPLSVTVAAQLGILPLLAFHFHAVSLVAPLANLLVLPLASLTLLLGIVSFLFWLFFPALGIVLAKINQLLLVGMIKVVTVCGDLPASILWVRSPWKLLIFLYYALLLLWVWAQFQRGRPTLRQGEDQGAEADRRSRPHPGMLLLPVTAAFSLVLLLFIFFPAPAQVTFLDVGQGDAALVQFPDRKTLLIDGGGVRGLPVSYLHALGVGKVDLLILTHPHEDHLEGVVSLLPEIPVGMLLGPYALTDSLEEALPIYHQFVEMVKARAIPYQQARQGQVYRIGRAGKVEILWPGETLMRETSSDLNNNSVVAKVTIGSSGATTLLFPGDVEWEGEGAMLSSLPHPEILSAQILKVPHHGSGTATTARLLRLVRPEVSIVSVGRRNRYGHPDAWTLRRLARYSHRVFRTDVHGGIRIILHPPSYTLQACTPDWKDSGKGSRRLHNVFSHW